MSWAKDEWKDGLNISALKNIALLEQQYERLLKDNKQKQFQLEGSIVALEKQKRLTEEEKGRYSLLKRDNQLLSESCEDLEKNRQKVLHDNQLKDGRLSCLEGQLNRLKQHLDTETKTATELKNELERVQCDYTQGLKKYEKQASELAKLQENNSLQKRQIEGQIEKIKSLESRVRQTGDITTRPSSFSTKHEDQHTGGSSADLQDLQTKYEDEMQLRLKIQHENSELWEKIHSGAQTSETPNPDVPLASENKPDVSPAEQRETLQLKKQLMDVNNQLARLETQLQACEKDLTTKAQLLKEKEQECTEVMQSLDEKAKKISHISDELLKTTSQLDQTKTQLEVTERKWKQLGQELECQRHNFESVIKSHEERIKEKEKQHREDLSSHSQVLSTLDKQHREILTKLQHEQQSAQATERDLQAKLDRALQDCEKQKHQLVDAKQEESNKEHAIKSKDQTITELGQEIKSLKQEKNRMIADLDREIMDRKKLEDQLNAAKNEVQRKDNAIKSTETKAQEQVNDVEKMRKQAMCDLENLRTVEAKLEAENKEFKKQHDGNSSIIERKEHEVTELNQKLEMSEKEIHKLGQEIQQHREKLKEQQERYTRLEAQLKDADQFSKARTEERNDEAKKLIELEQKCVTLEQQRDNAMIKLEEAEKQKSELKSQKENVQQLLDGRTKEIELLKSNSAEFENSKERENSVLENKVVELVNQVAEYDKHVFSLQQDLDKARREEVGEKRIISETRNKLEQCELVIKNHDEDVAKKEKAFDDHIKNLKIEITAVEEKIKLLKKEKEQEKQEFTKLLQQKSEECFKSVTELEKKTNEASKLKESQLNLQNLLTSHEQDRNKMETAIKELCEKTQKKEEELLSKCEALLTENASFNEKGKNLETTIDALKRDVKALQHDYKKACELADLKSAEHSHLVDQLEASHKHTESCRQRVVLAESALQEHEKLVKELSEEKDNLTREIAMKGEELESTKKEAEELISEKQTQSSMAEERVIVLSQKLNEAMIANADKTTEVERIASRITELETALENSQTCVTELREKCDNSNDVTRRKESEVEEIAKALKETETKMSELQQELNEKSDNANGVKLKCDLLESQREEQFSIIEAKELQITSYVKELESLQSGSEIEMKNLKQQASILEEEVSTLKAKSSQLEAVVHEKEAELCCVRTEASSSEEKLARLQELLQCKDLEISDLTALKSSLELKLEETNGIHKEWEAEQESKTKELADLQEILDSKQEEYDTVLRDSKGRMAILLDNNEQLNQALENSRKELDDAQAGLEMRTKELCQLQRSCGENEATFDDVRQENDSLVQQKGNLAAALKQKDIELEQQTCAVKELQHNLASDTTNTAKKEDEFATKFLAMNEEFERVSAIVKTKERELKDALEVSQDHENECKQLREMMDETADLVLAVEDEKSTLTQKQEHLLSSLSSKENELSDVNERLKTLEGNQQSLVEQKAEELEKFNKETNSMKQKLAQASEFVESQKSEILSLEETITGSKGDRDQLYVQLEELKNSHNELQAEYSNVFQKNQHLSDTIARKEAEITRKEEELESLKKNLKSVEGTLTERDNLKQQVSALVAKCVQSDELVKVKGKQCADLSVKIEEVQKDSMELKKALELKCSLLNDTEEALNKTVVQRQTLTGLLENQEKELASQVEEMKIHSGELEKELDRKSSLLDRTQESLDEALTAKERLSSLMEAKEKEFHGLNQDNEEGMKEKESMAERLSVLENELNSISEMLENTTEQKTQLESLIQKLQFERDEISNERDSIRCQVEEEVTTLREKLSEKEQSDKLLQAEKERLSDRLLRKEKEMEKTKETLLQLENGVESMKAQNEIMQMDFEDKDSLITSLQQQMEQLELLVAEFRQKATEKEESCKSVSQKFEALQLQFDVIQMDLEDRQGRVEELETKTQGNEVQMQKLTELNNRLKEALQQAEKSAEEASVRLNEKSHELEQLEVGSDSAQGKADLLVMSLQCKVKDLEAERTNCERNIEEKVTLVKRLEDQVLELEKQTSTMQTEKQDMESSFTLTVESLKLAKEAVEKELQEISGQYSATNETLESRSHELEDLKTSIRTERVNLLNSNEEMVTRKEALEEEMKLTLENLQQTEECLTKATEELANALESQSVSESMLVAVDSNLQSCKRTLMEKEQRVKEIEVLLCGKEEECEKLKILCGQQEERLDRLKTGLNENSQEKEKLLQEKATALQQLKETRSREIESLKEELSRQEADFDKERRVLISNVGDYKQRMNEIEFTLAMRKQAAVERDHEFTSLTEEFEKKAAEVETARLENEKLVSMREEKEERFGAEIQRLKNEVWSKEEDLRKVKEKVNNLTKNTEVLQEGNEMSLASIRNENNELQCEIDTLASTLETTAAELQRKCEHLEAMETELKEEEELHDAECIRIREMETLVQNIKSETEKANQEEQEQLINKFRKDEEELQNALEHEQEKSQEMGERIDKLREELASVKESKESLVSEGQRKMLELIATSNETEHQLKMACTRIDGLLEDKRVHYDSMQLAERESHKARCELENEIKSSKHRVNTLKEELEGCKAQIESLSDENSKLESKLERMQNNVVILEQKAKECDRTSLERIVELSSQLESSQAEVNRMDLEKRDVEKMLERTKTELEEVFEKLKVIECEKKSTEVILGESEELRGSIELLQDKVNNLEVTNAELCSELEESRVAVSSLKSQLKSSENSLEIAQSKHETEYTCMKEHIEKLENSNSDLSEKLDKAVERNESESQTSLQRSNEIMQIESSLRAQLEEKIADVRQLEEENSEVTEVNEMLSEKIERIEEELEHQRKEVTAISGKTTCVNQDWKDAVDELENVRSEARNTIEKSEEQIRVLGNRVEKIQQDLENLATEKATLQRENEERLEEVASLKQLKEVGERATDEFKDELATLRTAVTNQTEELSALRMETSVLKETVEAKQREMEEMQGFFNTTNEDLDALCEQRGEEMGRLKIELSTKQEEAEDLRRNLNEKEEDFEALKEKSFDIARQLDSLTAKHADCKTTELLVDALRQQLLQVEHLMSREKSNSEALMKAFEVREVQWEEERSKLEKSVASRNNTTNDFESKIGEELYQCRSELQHIRDELRVKENELESAKSSTEKSTLTFAELEAHLHTKIEAAEQKCEELKYSLQQKMEELFVTGEKLKEKGIEIESLDKKYAAAEEIELELRHHLGDITQELEKMREAGASEGGDKELRVLRNELKEAQLQMCDLNEKLESKDTEMEEEITRIVKAAESFALERQKEFEQQLAEKDDQLQATDNELNQTKHQLQKAQELKTALIEASEEREREFEMESLKLQGGAFTNEKANQLAVDLKIEKQQASQLEESCKKLQEAVDKGNITVVSLQKQLDQVVKEYGVKERNLEEKVASLSNAVESAQGELECTKALLARENTRITGILAEKHVLQQSFDHVQKESHQRRLLLTEAEEECQVLKEQLDKLKKAQNTAEQEREVSIVNESNEKVKLGKIERQLEKLNEVLEEEERTKTELLEKVKKIEFELTEETAEKTRLQDNLNAASKEKMSLEERCISLKKTNADIREENTELTKLFTELETIHNNKERELAESRAKLKDAKKDVENLMKENEQENEFLKVQLLLVEEKCAQSRRELEDGKSSSGESIRKAEEKSFLESDKLKKRTNELQARYDKSKACVSKLDSELSQLRCRVSQLETENGLLKQSRLKGTGNQKGVATDEVSNLQSTLKELKTKLSEEKDRADEKEKEANQAVDDHHADIQRYRKLEKQNSSLQRRLEFVAQKLKKKETAALENVEQLVKPSGNSGTSPEARDPVVCAVAASEPSMLSPLARSMSSLGISSQAVTTVTAARESAKALPPPRAISLGLPVRGGVSGNSTRPGTSIPTTTSLNKRPAEQVHGRAPKRTRVTSQGDSVPGSQDGVSGDALPEGLPEVVSKGFADIPDVPMKSPFILRRTTAQVTKFKATAAATGIKTRSQAKFTHIPTFSRGTAKENPSGARSPPRPQRTVPQMVLSPRKTNLPRRADSPKKTHIPVAGIKRTQVGRPARRTSSGKHQQATSTRSSLRQPKRMKPLDEGQASQASDDQPDKCHMQ